MKIIFDNNVYIYLLAYLVIPFFIFYKSKLFKKNEYNDDFFSKENTNELKGIFILLVAFAHITQRMNPTIGIMPLVLGGNLANAMFLFISGYSIMESFRRKRDYLKGFAFKRLHRVYMPFVIVNLVILVFYNLALGESYTLKDFVVYSLEIKYLSTGSALWYIIATLYLYLAFYIAFKYFKAKHSLVVLTFLTLLYVVFCKYLHVGIWWYNTALCFPVGAYLSYKKDLIINFIKNNYIKTFTVSLVGCMITFISFIHPLKGQLIWNVAFTMFFSIFVISAMLKINLNSKVYKFLGEISYEMYLTHMMLLFIYFKLVHLSGSYSVYLFLLGSIILSICLKRIMDYKLPIRNSKITVNQ
jgi:membrane-bound acyltransferase YfiQ involved in biofilm formation